MAESKTGITKAPTKNSVASKRTTAKKITLKEDLDSKSVVKKTPVKKPAKEKPVTKQTPASVNKDLPEKTPETLETVKSLVHEMRREHNKRDQQITAMVHEISQGFSAFADQGNEREERSLQMLKALTDAMIMDHEKNRLEVQQQEKLQNDNVIQIAKRNRLIAIPGVIIAVFAIIAILYVVNMLGTAMTNISTDIHKMQLSVAGISTRMDSMSLDINSMSGNMQQLNRNVTNMSKDLSVLSYTVAPTMRGMRNIMPWAP